MMFMTSPPRGEGQGWLIRATVSNRLKAALYGRQLTAKSTFLISSNSYIAADRRVRYRKSDFGFRQNSVKPFRTRLTDRIKLKDAFT